MSTGCKVRVDDFGGDAFLRQYCGGGQRGTWIDVAHDGEVVAFALYVGFSERYLIGAIWYGAAFVHETVGRRRSSIRAGEQDRTHQSLASAGVDGMTTCRPGVFQYHDCGLPECCTPPPPRMPNFT